MASRKKAKGKARKAAKAQQQEEAARSRSVAGRRKAKRAEEKRGARAVGSSFANKKWSPRSKRTIIYQSLLQS
jgi:hypothetical protein